MAAAEKSKLDLLKAATTRQELARLLDIKPSILTYILYKKDSALKYKTFSIPKRSGGTREINAPSDDLKTLQKALAVLLQGCLNEIHKTQAFTDHVAHGFMPDRSIVTNAYPHRGRRYVFNIDLKDFFGSITFPRLRGFFIKDRNFSLNEKIATVLAQIACHEGKLPQGSPCSPIMSNVIGHILDMHLVRLAAKNGCHYSRYADDLTFSTNRTTFPSAIAKFSGEKVHEWIPGRQLAGLVKKCAFEINATKTRMQYRASRQEVTGLIVNTKINVRSEYRHLVRLMVNRVLKTGEFTYDLAVIDDTGVATAQRTPGTLEQLHGMLGFIHGIDSFNKSLIENNSHNHPQKSNDPPSSKETMYLRFLLYKILYMADKPLIICEGKTDNVYLTHAIRSLSAKFPQLLKVDAEGKTVLNVRLFKYTDKSTGRLFGIESGGAPGLSKLMRSYSDEVKKFRAPGAKQPVIVLVDNDAGATKKGNVFATFANLTHRPKPTGHEPFLHVIKNLYVVATPLNGKATSCSEDFFGDDAKSIQYEGKEFDPTCPKDSKTHYNSKSTFAYDVVVPNAAVINFDKFAPLLQNLVAAIDFHAAKNNMAPS